MKNYPLVLSIRVEVETVLSLFETIKELENKAQYTVIGTDNVKVVKTEILMSIVPNS